MKNAQQLILAYAEAPWRKQLQMIGLFSLGLVLVALVASLYLVVSAQAATYGREIQQMQYDIQELQRQNADLGAMLARLNSAAVMDARTQELGLIPATPEQIVYLQVEGYLPRQPASFASSEPPAVVEEPGYMPSFDQPLFSWIGEQIIGDMDFETWILEVTSR